MIMYQTGGWRLRRTSMDDKKITSIQNTRIKSVVKLRKRHNRDNRGLMLIEGARELSRALGSGVEIEEAFVCSELVGSGQESDILQEMRKRGVRTIEVTRPVLEKIAIREDSSSIVAVARQREHSLSTLPQVDDPFYLVADAVEKPGNLGAMLRTADAAGITGLIASDPRTDLYNPNIIRSSLGTVFSVPVAMADSGEAARWLRERGIKIITSSPDAETPYTSVDLTGPCALVVGSEELGAGEIWLDSPDIVTRIPMMGIADSLNVSAAAAVLMYEALRQRTAGITDK